MQQYLELLKTIKDKGTYKPAAREGMPGTQSLFGYQFRHNLADGFPLLTTKEINFKHIVVELLWFLRGDTNIKYLVDNGVNIWNEDAYNYYLKIHKNHGMEEDLISYETFTSNLKNGVPGPNTDFANGIFYKLGDCGYQYGKVWRGGFVKGFTMSDIKDKNTDETTSLIDSLKVDQISNLIKGLKNNPESRRHIVTAIDPAHDTDLALYWCHCMMQFNCRPLTMEQQKKWWKDKYGFTIPVGDEWECIPKYYLDCQMYQRSADVFLGVPYNIASYALLTEILAKICNMIPGEFIHTFGDVHVYDNHKDQVEEQLSRTPTELPKLILGDDICVRDQALSLEYAIYLSNCDLDSLFKLENYNPKAKIKAKLSTGMKK